MPSGKPYDWSNDMHRFCDQNRKMLRRELAGAFNARFGTERSFEAIRNFCKRNGYHTGRTGFFAKGAVPHNKGRTGVLHANCIPTQFKRGNRPTNAQPVGTEVKIPTRKGKDPGYWKVKIAEPNTWHSSTDCSGSE